MFWQNELFVIEGYHILWTFIISSKKKSVETTSNWPSINDFKIFKFSGKNSVLGKQNKLWGFFSEQYCCLYVVFLFLLF